MNFWKRIYERDRKINDYQNKFGSISPAIRYLKTTIMKRLLIFVLPLLLLGCNNFSQKGTEKNVTEQREIEQEIPLSKVIDVVSVETGWYNEQRPQVKIKFKNNSGKAIHDYIRVKYQFVEGDEVFDEGYSYLHTSDDVDWNDGLSKTKIYRSAMGYRYGGQLHKVRAKICFEDNSLIWEGNIKQKDCI